MLLTVLRHGRTAWNLAGRFQGSSDVPLDDEGRAQARHARERLSGERFDRVISSDLVRAVETAEIVTGGRVAIERDPQWRELAFGEWEGLTWAQIEAAYPAIETGDHPNLRTFDPPGGESFDDLCVRIAAAMNALQALCAPAESILIVTHAAPIHALLRILGVSPGGALRVKLVPASISRFSGSGAAWELVALNTIEGPILGGTEFLSAAEKAG